MPIAIGKQQREYSEQLVALSLRLPTVNRPPTNRIFGLDILRAAAILFVMQMHSLAFIHPHADAHYYWLFILDGVDLFFVLSGFLIGGILVRTIDKGKFGTAELYNFWIRRWFRTLPNYFLVLIALLVAYHYAFGEFPDKTLQYFVFTQNFNDPHPDFFPEAWSLSVEEWFYLIIPLLLFIILKFSNNKKIAFLSLIIFFLVIITAYRTYKAITGTYFENGFWDAEIRKLVLTRMDSIMYGLLGAWIEHYYKAGWLRWKNILFIAGLIILFGSRWLGSVSDWHYQYGYISLQSIGTLLLLPRLSSITTGKGAVAKFITFISIISYSLYLLNYTIVLKIIVPAILDVFNMDFKTGIIDSVIGYVLFWGISIALAYLLYRFWERPMMRLRERFGRRSFKRRSRSFGSGSAESLK